MLAQPTRRATYHRALGSGETQTLRMREDSDAQKGAACSKNDPLGEGSNASSYRQRALESGGLLPQMRGNLDAQKGAACS